MTGHHTPPIAIFAQLSGTNRAVNISGGDNSGVRQSGDKES
jgi:hypothetical protein